MEMRRNRVRFATAAMLMSILVSCMTMPETKIFSLYRPIEEERILCKSDLSIHVFTNAPKHLSQPYIIYRKSDFELDTARYAKWDSAPDETINNTYRLALSPLFRDIVITRYQDRKAHQVAIELRRFERLDEGEKSFAALEYDFFLRSPDGREIYHRKVMKKEALETRDNLNLAMAMSAALMESVEEVIADLGGIMSSAPAAK